MPLFINRDQIFAHQVHLLEHKLRVSFLLYYLNDKIDRLVNNVCHFDVLLLLIYRHVYCRYDHYAVILSLLRKKYKYNII